MRPWCHVHSSSRYDRPAAGLTAAAYRYNLHGDHVTYTEVDFEERERAVRKANGTEFGLVSGDEGHANDCVQSYKLERFDLVYTENFKASDIIVYRTDGHPRDPVYATIAVFQDRESGHVLVSAVIHLASNVEGDTARHQATNRVRQWHDAFRRTKNRVNKIAKHQGADGRMITADFNLDFKKAWVRALVKTMAPAYSSTWKNLGFSGGTHGHRVIDATLLRGKIKVRGSARLMADDVSSDHRPYIETLEWVAD